MEILRVENLSFRYPQADEEALKQVNFRLNSGEFAVICGESGCGKTTLLRLLKQELTPAGEKKGRIYFDGAVQEERGGEKNASGIGFVMQDPDSQIVTDRVWHELAFGLENLGLPADVIRRRVGEMASYFGIHNWFRRSTDELSGGQKQILNLAAVMVTEPKLLLLDEPTSRLDPIAAADFIRILQKLNRELGLTILLVEHCLEEGLPLADRVLLMERGALLLDEPPRRIGCKLADIDRCHPMLAALPGAARIYYGLNGTGESPLSVREGKTFLEEHFRPAPVSCSCPCPEKTDPGNTPAIELKNVWFRYERDLPDILRGVSFQVPAGKLTCILGGNGTGKTTALRVISGLNRAYRGKVMIGGRPIRSYKGNSLYRNMLAFLPQDVQTVFIRDSVREDYREILAAAGVSPKQQEARIGQIAERLGIVPLLDRHPYDLSGGEQQKCALGKVLLLDPKILLLDEPTKGLDAWSKHTLLEILTALKENGMTILMVTHDVEFAAAAADLCALFFDGEIFSADIPRRFFAGNHFYTTSANRMARGLWPEAITCEQVIECCRMAEGREEKG